MSHCIIINERTLISAFAVWPSAPVTIFLIQLPAVPTPLSILAFVSPLIPVLSAIVEERELYLSEITSVADLIPESMVSLIVSSNNDPPALAVLSTWLNLGSLLWIYNQH